MAETVGSGKTADFYIASVPHALATHYFLRITRARRGGLQGGRRESSLLTFAALFVSEKREEKKSYFMFLRGRTMFAPTK